MTTDNDKQDLVLAVFDKIAELAADNKRLREENAKLRSLVERASAHIGCSCMECPQVEKECKEALK
jgi:hypothetical protein